MPKLRVVEKQPEPPHLHMRVSKSSGRLMIGLAIFFDLLPFLSLVLLLVFVMMGVANILGLDNIKSCAEFSERWWKIGDGLRCGKMIGDLFLSATVTIGTFVIMGSVVYAIMSWVSTFIAYVLFTIWFWVKGVRIWSLSKASKLLLNVVTFIIEMIPLLDLLPSTTFMVWRHVKVSQTEDRIKHRVLVKKHMKAVKGGGRRMMKKAA